MIIKIGNASLLPWTFMLYGDKWVRYSDNGSVKLRYDTFFPRWYPEFCGDFYYLKDMFETYSAFGNYKHKHHLAAMEQMDKFLIRMGKLTIFL